MAFDTTQQFPGHISAGIRRLDAVETDVFRRSKRNPGRHRIRLHGAIRKTRSSYATARAVVVIGITTPTGAAALEALFRRGHLW